MPAPHKHAAVIKAWADGAQIEYRRTNDSPWRTVTEGSTFWFAPDQEYRVKPQYHEVHVVTWISSQGVLNAHAYTYKSVALDAHASLLAELAKGSGGLVKTLFAIGTLKFTGD